MSDQIKSAREPPDTGTERRPQDEWKAGNIERAAVERHERIFLGDPTPPLVLIRDLIPCDAFGLVGAGGTAKSTFALWLMIHIVLGRRVLDRSVRQADCLYISAEDPQPVIDWRIRQLSDAMALGELEQMRVAKGLHVEDFTGTMRRLVEADGFGNLFITGWADAIAEKYAASGISLCMLDPAIYFGPGERFVNDAEAALMQAARRISNRLGTAAVGYIHHVGQAAARDGIADQYAGRGGSAFADNARGVLVMHAHAKDVDEFPTPPEVTQEAMDEGRAFRLHIAKFSYGKRLMQPAWILRSVENPWDFQLIAPVPDLCAAKAEAIRQRNEQDDALVRAYIAVNQETVPLSRNSIEEGMELPQKRVRRAIRRLEADGKVITDAPVPEHLAAKRPRGPKTCVRTATGVSDAGPFSDEP